MSDRDAPAPFITAASEITDAVLNAVAHLPTASLAAVVEPAFFAKLTDAQFMRIATHLARKSYDEGGCPIGAVIVDNASRRIVGKGHNTLVQDNDPYNHGETAAMRDAGRADFGATTIFTTLSPCAVCAALIHMRGFARVVIGDVTNASGTEATLRDAGVAVEILEDPQAVTLYARYRAARPELDLEDWQGVAAVTKRRK
jgi:cytosine deaminase